jgi:hypothetical protein
MSWMKRTFVALVTSGTALTALLGIPGPANAEGIAIVDQAGDKTGAGLDFTNVSVRNKDQAIVTVMTFKRDRRGEIIVAVRARGHGLVARVVSAHPRQGADQLRLFTRGNDATPCPGLRSTWDRDAAEMRLRLPSKCLLDGDYGAVRSWFLTEEFGGGSDVDFAPDGTGWTSWISRG